MKPGPGCARSLSWLCAAALWSTISLLAGPAIAGKPAAKGKPVAKAKAAAKKSDSSSSSSSSSASSASSSKSSGPYEVPSPAGPEVPPSGTTTSTSTSTSTSTETATASGTATTSEPPKSELPSAEAAKEPVKEVLPDAPKDSATEPVASLPAAEQAPVPSEPMAPYVEHLGPSSYPGKLRGIYGGSMWLEPDFHGLQWPVMAKSGVGVSGWFWVDNGYSQIRRDEGPNTKMWLQQGRAALRVTPTYTNGSFFIQAQAELVANVCQVAGTTCATTGTFDTDDLWIRFGQWNAWDVKVGRFEGWELYHTGMGLDLYTFERRGASNLGLPSATGLDVPDFYGVNWMQLRPQSGLGRGYLAFHAYPTDTLRFELLGQLGADNPAAEGGMTYLGARPAVIWDKGWVKAKVGAEYETAKGDTGTFDTGTGAQASSKIERTRKGVGGTLQFVFDPYLELGGNFAWGTQDNHPTATGEQDLLTSFSRASVGGFANLRLSALWIVGAGTHFTWQNDKFYYNNSVSPNYTGHLQGFLSLQYFLARQLIIKAVVSYARADFVASDATIDVYGNYLYSGRVRLTYLY